MEKSVSILATGIGNRISAASDKIGTRIAAASAMQVSPDSLQRYIREERVPPLDAAAALCRAAGRTLDWLAFGVEPQMTEESENRRADRPDSDNSVRNSQGLRYDKEILDFATQAVQDGLDELDVDLPVAATFRVVKAVYEWRVSLNRRPTPTEIVAAVMSKISGVTRNE